MVTSLAWDNTNNLWIGTWGGLSKFDGTDWFVYNKLNSGLPEDIVRILAIDDQDTKWIGTSSSGLVKFDGSDWIIYNSSNSGLPVNVVSSMAIDSFGCKWIGTGGGGLVKFDGINWTIYDTSNSMLPDNNVAAYVVDNSNNIWLGTGSRGMVKFDGTNWTLFNTTNSGLPENEVGTILIDSYDNKLIGTNRGGLAVFKEGGITSTDEHLTEALTLPSEFILQHNYPNPFNPVTTIEYQLPVAAKVSIKLFDMLGSEIVTLVNETKDAGFYKHQFDGSTLASGTYFFRIQANDFVQTKKMTLLK
jgi:ligand-binding sensor domain-containing protein